MCPEQTVTYVSERSSIEIFSADDGYLKEASFRAALLAKLDTSTAERAANSLSKQLIFSEA
jgi:hypothetical protein